MVVRHALLAVLALLAGVGCHAGTSGGLTKPDPPLTKEALSMPRIIAQHNKNAVAIRSLRANPSIVVAADGRSGKLSGRLAMERPKDFRLTMASHGVSQADIGSNDRGFWFWVKDNKDKAIYVCDHEHINNSPLAATMQPDWILEAMGLREISEREARTIVAKAGDPGQIILTQPRKDPNGRTMTKETVVNETTGDIIEHRLYSGAKEELLARATISQHRPIEMLATDEDPSGSKVSIPWRFRLEWLVEKFTLDIAMGSDTLVNPDFPKETRTALFTEPTISGVARKDLASMGGPPAATSSRVYESAPRSSVRLGKPQAVPIDVEGAIPSGHGPLPLSSGLATIPDRPSGVVLAPIPQAVDSDAVQASGRQSWTRSTLAR